MIVLLANNETVIGKQLFWLGGTERGTCKNLVKIRLFKKVLSPEFDSDLKTEASP